MFAKVSHKTVNTPKLLAFWFVNIAIFSVVSTAELGVQSWSEILRSITTGYSLLDIAQWVSIASIIMLASIFNLGVPRAWKEKLVFCTQPRPGERAFSDLIKQDSTIDRKAIEAAFDPLPTDPGEQNRLWVRWLHEFDQDVRVKDVYKKYLWTRDCTAKAIAVIICGNVAVLFAATCYYNSFLYFGITFLQYFCIRLAAKNQGEQLVKTVLVCKAVALKSNS